MDFRESLIRQDATVRQAIEIIEASPAKVALVIEESGRLIGTVTDGDIRRGLLRGVLAEDGVSSVMNASPRYAVATNDKMALLALMRRDRLRHLPLVDADRKLVGLETLAELIQLEVRNNWVILMAGGEGQRLRPLTNDTPKPMLSVGPKPILETIIDSFISRGFVKFFISVNYLAARVEEHFGDGSSRGVSISYLREYEQLGTAGSLALLPERPAEPFFVMNGDILTNVDFAALLDFHGENRAAGTMCVREHVMQIPYGVVDVDGFRLMEIREKPVVQSFVNAGIYVLNPDILDYLDAGKPMGMPELFARAMAEKKNCVAFPMREYWLDVGQPDDYMRANMEFSKIFR